MVIISAHPNVINTKCLKQKFCFKVFANIVKSNDWFVLRSINCNCRASNKCTEASQSKLMSIWCRCPVILVLFKLKHYLNKWLVIVIIYMNAGNWFCIETLQNFERNMYGLLSMNSTYLNIFKIRVVIPIYKPCSQIFEPNGFWNPLSKIIFLHLIIRFHGYCSYKINSAPKLLSLVTVFLDC